MQHCECTECHGIVPFRLVNFILCKFASVFKKMCSKETQKEKGGTLCPCEPLPIVSGKKKANAWKGMRHLGA